MKRSYMLIRISKMIDAHIESTPDERLKYSDVDDCANRILIGIEDIGMSPPLNGDGQNMHYENFVYLESEMREYCKWESEDG